MFIVVLLITPQNWEQCKCHTSEEINKLWHIHPMELYSMTKKEQAKIWMYLRNIMLMKEGDTEEFIIYDSI